MLRDSRKRLVPEAFNQFFRSVGHHLQDVGLCLCDLLGRLPLFILDLARPTQLVRAQRGMFRFDDILPRHVDQQLGIVCSHVEPPIRQLVSDVVKRSTVLVKRSPGDHVRHLPRRFVHRGIHIQQRTNLRGQHIVEEFVRCMIDFRTFQPRLLNVSCGYHADAVIRCKNKSHETTSLTRIRVWLPKSTANRL
jgi:hypothetical protein